MYKKIISVMSVALVVFLCSSFPAFASIQPQQKVSSTVSGLDSDGSGAVTAYQLYGTLDVYDKEVYYPSTNSTYPVNVNYDGGTQDIVITGYIRNNSYTPMFCSGVTITVTDTSGTIKNLNGFQYLYGDLMPQLNMTGNSFTMVPQDYIAFEQGFIVAPMKTVYFAFSVSTFYNVGTQSSNTTLSSVTCSVGWCGHSDVWEGHYGYTVNYEPVIAALNNLLENDDGTLTIFDLVQEMHDAYLSNTQQSQGVSDQSSDITSDINDTHESEASYFEQTQSAINDTGIQDFQFDSESISGLTGIRDDFDAVFLSLGNLKTYFIASLTIGLALAIIRHRRMFEK